MKTSTKLPARHPPSTAPMPPAAPTAEAVGTKVKEVVGADLDVKSMLGTVGFKGPVDATVVNGRVVVKGGRLTGIDEEKGPCPCPPAASILHR